MFITKKHLSRRTVLKAAGFSLALPFLDAMVPAATALAKTSRALRVGFFYIPHGAIQGDTAFGAAGDRWTPSGSGNKFRLNEITQPLEPFKKYVSSVGNVVNAATPASTGPGPAGHTTRPATWLSCTRPVEATLDQIIAARFAGETPISSLQVASETTVQQGAGNGVSTAATLSFQNASSPLPVEYNPGKIFDQLFGDVEVGQLEERTSLLDLIQDQTKTLKGKLGKADKAVLDKHLESVRDVERRVQKDSKEQALVEKRLSDIMVSGRPRGILDFDLQVKLMFDLIALAYQTDMTRVVTYMMAAEATNRTYNHIGVRESFHPLSHHADDPQKIEKLVAIQKWHMAAFAQFLHTLSETPDGDGTLLDHSIFLYGSNMSNSHKHSNWPIPTVIVGKGNGKIRMGGRHIVPRERISLANVHLTLLNKIGIEQKVFADSTGTISEL
ncbi:MAG TPA: DUF1552 domain-containing protein [Terriglobia bacterium]|nr:DUF1552 domain-containing protein [Terriglobia bacterium]